MDAVGRQWVGENPVRMTDNVPTSPTFGRLVGWRNEADTKNYRFYDDIKKVPSANLVAKDNKGVEISNTHLTLSK